MLKNKNNENSTPTKNEPVFVDAIFSPDVSLIKGHTLDTLQVNLVKT